MKQFQILLILSLSIVLVSCKDSTSLKQVKLSGEAQGTYYVVTYYDAEERNFQEDIDNLLADFDKTASMWVGNSIISKINRNEANIQPNELFIHLFNLSKEIYGQSEGAFDPTVGPLVNAWGFGFTDRMNVDQHVVDSLLPLVGFNKVKLEDGQIIKNDPRIQLDFNAIAQGYSVDLIGEFLAGKGIKNFLIDIGGEVLAKGNKPDGELWKVGIENPKDNAQYGEGLKAIVTLKNRAMATSGNYRKFYEEDGVRYSHTINPKTGYPVQHPILSVSVLADDCASADAWATTFMVLGFEKSMEILADNKSLEAYFIYSGKDGKMQTHFTGGFKDILLEEM